MAKDLPELGTAAQPISDHTALHWYTWPDPQGLRTLARMFRLVDKADGGQTVAAMTALLAELRRVNVASKRHPRFNGVEVGLVSRRELRGVAQAIRQAGENLKRQADYLEQTR